MYIPLGAYLLSNLIETPVNRSAYSPMTRVLDTLLVCWKRFSYDGDIVFSPFLDFQSSRDTDDPCSEH